MGFARGPQINREGLIFALDTWNPRSFKYDSSSWINLANDIPYDRGYDIHYAFNLENALYFDGSTSAYVDGPAMDELVDGEPFTISLWVKNEHPIQGYGTFIRSGTERLLINGGGTLLTQQSGNFFSTISIEEDVWNNVVYRYDGDVEQWYFNTLFGGEQTIGAVANWTGTITFGRNDSVYYPYVGYLGMCYIYHRALSVEEITHNYNLIAPRYNLSRV